MNGFDLGLLGGGPGGKDFGSSQAHATIWGDNYGLPNNQNQLWIIGAIAAVGLLLSVAFLTQRR